MRQGVKISLEGIDGVGKTTQTPVVEEYLQDRGYSVYFKPCRNNMLGEGIDNDIVKILKGSRKALEEVPAAEVLLNAARTMFLHEKYIKEQLEKGEAVLCDRDIDTALAYSMPSLRRQYPEKTTRQLSKWMLGAYSIEPTVPDLTLLLDANTGVALGRALSDDVPNERAIFDEDGVAFLEEVQDNYRELHTMFPDRIKRIDVTDRSISEVSAELIGAVGLFLDQHEGGMA